MFVEVAEGRAVDTPAARTAWLNIQDELSATAAGFLGVTAGAMQDGAFVALLMFETEEMARMTMSRARDGGLWDRLGRIVHDLAFREYPNVRAFSSSEMHHVERIEVTRGTPRDVARIAAMFDTGSAIRRSDPTVVGGLLCWDAKGAVTVLYRGGSAGEGAMTGARRQPEPALLDAERHLEIDGVWSTLAAGAPVTRARPSARRSGAPAHAAHPHIDTVAPARAAAAIGRWMSIGPTLIPSGLGATGRVTTIAIDPSRPSTIYVAALSGNPSGAGGSGVWKTTDGGASWRPIADDLPSLKVSAVALAPATPSRLYAALVDLANAGVGFYRSDDAGSSWTLVVEDALVNGRQLLIDPSDPSRMFMANSNGVIRSVDGGASWSIVLSQTGARITDLAMDPLVPTRLYAGVSHPSSDMVAGVYVSSDSGTSWAKQIGCPGGALPTGVAGRTIRIALSGNRVYASFKTSDEFVVYRTTDMSCLVGPVRERSWQQGWRVGSDTAPALWSYLYAHPDDEDLVYATGTQFWRSTNGGASFSIMSGPHVDHHAFAVDPADSDIVYTGCDGGVYRSNDRGASGSWSFIGEGMTNTEFYDIGHAPTEPDLVLGGTQDNGTVMRRAMATVWDEIMGGDGATVDVDPTDHTVLYAMGQYASSIARRKGSGGFQGLSAGLPMGSMCFNLHYHVHPAVPTTLLASCGSLWRTLTNEPPGDWQAILPAPGSPMPAGNVVRSAVDGSADIYYAASDQGEIYAAVDGADWELVFTVSGNFGVSAAAISALVVDPDDPATLYAAIDRTRSFRIARLRRLSPNDLAMAAEDITTDLPVDLRVSALAVDRMNTDTIYAGTMNRAVYRGRLAFGAWRWDRYSDGLPFAAAIVDLLAHPTTGVLRAGTCGRGAFEVSTDHPIGSVLAIEGIPIFLRVHDAGGFGPPHDPIDGEVVVRLDTAPRKAFGFQLRADPAEPDHAAMLELLRAAFISRRRVRIEYVRTGLRNGRAFRASLAG